MALDSRIVVLVATFLLKAAAQFNDNSPPVMYLQRNWVIRESEPVGYIVGRVQAEDNEQDELTFGLEASHHSYDGKTRSQKSLPFAIDNTTGTVYLNESLKGRAGENILLYVTVSDGQLTAKSEVYVEIDSSTGGFKTGFTRPSFPGKPGPAKLPGLPGKIPIRPILHFGTMSIPPSSSPSPTTKPIPSFTSSSTSQAPEVSTQNSIVNSTANSTSIPPVIVNKEVDGPPSSAKVAPSEAPTNQDIAIVLVPVAVLSFVVLIIVASIWSLIRNRKGSASVRVSSVNRDPSFIFKRPWQGIFGNRTEKRGKNFENAACMKLRDDKFEFPRHKLKVGYILGEGCFGQVWRCEALDINGSPGLTVVAVKTLKENAGERERLDLAQELKVMKNLEPHPHVVRLLGCCTEREPIFVILEYVSGGKLQSFLRASREERNKGGPGLTSRDLTGFVYQVAKGMEYLTSKGIIHRDLAARNVLIDDNRICKVADFGFARDVATNQIYERKSEGRLPIRWMAPESLYDNIFSVKSDIWSFGVLIWEIVTLGSTPYPGMAAAEVMRRIKEGYRLDRPEHCKRELYNIMYYCWDKDPACRPSFMELVNLAEGLLLDETDYIELDRFPDHSYYNVLNLSGEKL